MQAEKRAEAVTCDLSNVSTVHHCKREHDVFFAHVYAGITSCNTNEEEREKAEKRKDPDRAKCLPLATRISVDGLSPANTA